MLKNLTLLALLVITSVEIFAQIELLPVPPTKKVDIVDDYFGKEIPDPYRWLEDLSNPEVQMWAGDQNHVAVDYLHKLPQLAAYKTALTKYYSYDRQSPLVKEGKYFYYKKNSGLEEQDVLVELKSFSYPTEDYLNPQNDLKEGEKLHGFSFSNNGNWFAYQVSQAGSDLREIRIMDHRSRRAMRDKLTGVKYSNIAWLGDGFYYRRYPMPADDEKFSAKVTGGGIYFHKPGYDQNQDELIMEFGSETFTIKTSRDEKLAYLIGYDGKGQGNSLAYRLTKNQIKGDFTPLFEGHDFDARVIEHDELQLFVLTNKGAENFRVVEIDLAKPSEDKWKTIIPSQPDMTIVDVLFAGEHFIVKYLKEGYHVVKAYNRKGKFAYDIELPEIGTVGRMAGNKASKTVYFSFSSYTFPTQILKYTIATGRTRTYFEPNLEFDPREYEVKRETYSSKDGSKVPMYIVYKKPIAMFSENPTLLYGYGGFGIGQTPKFKPELLPFLDKGGVLAFPCLRGGNELGEEWHRAGMLDKKQNVFDDFIAAAEYLIAQKYTSSQKLAIAGRSNGGLLVAAVANQRPDLFKVVQPTVGVMDMLRYQNFTIGKAWVREYGSSDNESQFKYLRKYSPLHNVMSGIKYPAYLLMTADHDDRVVPSHSYKLAATLQAETEAKYPILLRLTESSGHKTTTISQTINDWSERMAFIMYHLGMDAKQ